MEKTVRIVPAIDFKYWNDKNNISSSTRHRGVVTVINNNFAAIEEKIESLKLRNYPINLPYFLNDYNKIDRLRNLEYNDLEKEIMSNINIFDFDNYTVDELFKIFDLIQIWGGGAVQGGGGPYRISDNRLPARLDYVNWVDNYINIIKAAVEKDTNAYNLVLEARVPFLAMSFGSKHISFWSRKKSNDKCLVVIDNKIAGTTGIRDASRANFKKIIEDIHLYAEEKNLEPQQIEKALFSFHESYFNNINTKFTGIGKTETVDYLVAVEIAKKLGINSNPKVDVDNTAIPTNVNKSSKSIVLSKGEYIKLTNGDIFLSAVYVEKHKLNKYVDISNKATLSSKNFLKYTGELSNIKYI